MSNSKDEYNIDDVLSDEKKRIDLLDNSVAAIMKERIVQQDGSIKVNLKPSELESLARAQSTVNDMRRKNAGLAD